LSKLLKEIKEDEIDKETLLKYQYKYQRYNARYAIFK
jgi:hypothetical protein